MMRTVGFDLIESFQGRGVEDPNQRLRCAADIECVTNNCGVIRFRTKSPFGLFTIRQINPHQRFVFAGCDINSLTIDLDAVELATDFIPLANGSRCNIDDGYSDNLAASFA